jgi:hypothetical protein
LLPPASTQDLFAPVADAARAVDTALAAGTVAPSALTTASSTDTTQSLAQLEQALFSDWLASLQSTIVPSATPSLDLLLSGVLDLGLAASTVALQSSLGTPTGQAANVNSALVSLFNTMQLLGTTPTQALPAGSQLDILA